MHKKQLLPILVLAVLSAFAGATLSSRFFMGRPLFALGSKNVSAQEFKLVDSKGIIRAVLTTHNNDLITQLELKDRNGRTRVSFIVDGNGNPSAHFWDKQASGSFIPASTPSINFWDRNDKLRGTTPEGTIIPKGLSSIPAPKRKGGKADSARPEDVKFLQDQVDQLWITVNKTREVVNKLIE